MKSGELFTVLLPLTLAAGVFSSWKSLTYYLLTQYCQNSGLDSILCQETLQAGEEKRKAEKEGERRGR